MNDISKKEMSNSEQASASTDDVQSTLSSEERTNKEGAKADKNVFSDYKIDNWVTPQKKKKKKFNFSYVWLVPLIATLGVCWLIYDSLSNRGEMINIRFQSAQGLQAGRTEVRYQGITMGKVSKIDLSNDLKTINVQIQMEPHATKILREDTQFWLVQPKATITEISGLDTLISGNYIELSPGKSTVMTNDFVALQSPPPLKLSDKSGRDGLIITLTSPQLDSIQVGAKLLYKKIEVGEVLSYRMENNQVLISAFVKSQYKGLVKKESRFWNMSGISAKIGFNGLQVEMGNLTSILQGGIAFDSPPNSPVATKDSEKFILYSNADTAERSIAITVDLPLNSNSIKEGTPIIYQGVQIGKLTDADFNQERTKMVAHATVLPQFSDLLTDNSRFLIEETDLLQLKNMSNVVLGNYLTLQNKPGKPSVHFIAQTLAQQRQDDPSSLKLTLTAGSSLGLKVGSKIFYKGVVVGYVTHLELTQSNVFFNVVIANQYRYLVRSESSFYIDSGIQSQIGAQGINVNIPSVEQLLQSGISFTSDGDSKPRDNYLLYESKTSAQLADKNALGVTEYRLVTDTMPPVTENSSVLYKNMAVGRVKSFKMDKDKIYITLEINNQYVNLINNKTVFWNYSGVNFNASMSGINFEMGPLTSLLSGSITFDTINDIPNKLGKDWRLYSSLKDAQKVGRNIYFNVENSMGLSKGSKIKYSGIEVGEVTKLVPDFKNKKVKIAAVLYTQYASALALSTSRFWVVSSQISLSGIKNADALIAPYIGVDVQSVAKGTPSAKKSQSIFPLYHTPSLQSGLQIVLEAKTKNSIAIGTPLLYRELEVGEVTDIELGSLSDRILFTVNIKPEYAYLVRDNTVFWNMSGINFDVSLLKGATLKTGSVDSIIKGGIAFATPEPQNNQTLAPQVVNGKRFFLNMDVNPEWSKWQTLIPK